MGAMKNFATEELEREIRLDEQKDHADLFEQLYTALNAISAVRNWVDTSGYQVAEDLDADKIFDDLKKIEIETRGAMERLGVITDPDQRDGGTI